MLADAGKRAEDLQSPRRHWKPLPATSEVPVPRCITLRRESGEQKARA